MESSVRMTPRAENRMAELFRDRGIADPILRVFASAGSGCGGAQFGMTIVEQREASDVVISLEQLTLLVDQQSAPLLDGAEIDFVEGTMSSGFTISNPNVSTSCACGAGGCGDGARPSCC
jgi:iron-sulfur cluster assembly accessory protein